MSVKRDAIIKVLINRFHRSVPDALLRRLPAEDAQAVRNSQISANDIAPALQLPQEQIQLIHYSWLTPIFKQLSPPLQNLLFSVLPSDYGAKLKNLLNLKLVSEIQPEPVQRYLLSLLYSRIKLAEVLPLDYLPNTPLLPLSKLNKRELVELVDYMGIHDLAESMRHIIDKNFLTKLYNCLNTRQRQCLRQCLHQHDKVSTTRLNLEKWDGSVEKLDDMLQRRGLLRLGKAMCGQHPDFIWHISHRFDSGRGTILAKHASQEATAGVTAHLIQQVLNMINFLFVEEKDSSKRDQ